MAPDSNENTYVRQFDSSLRRSPKTRPVAVTMNISMTDRATAREFRVYAKQSPKAPLYHLDCGDGSADLGMRAGATVRVLGRHFFTW